MPQSSGRRKAFLIDRQISWGQISWASTRLTRLPGDTKVSPRKPIPERYFQPELRGGTLDDRRQKRTDQASTHQRHAGFGRRPGHRPLPGRARGRHLVLRPGPAPWHPASRLPRACRPPPRAPAPTGHRRRGVPRPLPRTPLVRGRRAARRAWRHRGPARAHRHGGALSGVRREERHRRRVPGRSAAPDGRGHRLRPGLGVQAVHLDPRRAADRAGCAGTGGDGGLVPPGLRPGGQAGHHDPSAPHAHLGVPLLDPALQRADVRGEAPAHLERGATEPAGHHVPLLGPEPDLPPARAGEDHRSRARHPPPRGDHRPARHASHPLQPARRLEAEHRGHRGRPQALVRPGPGARVGRGA